MTFEVGLTSASNVGFMTEVRVAGVSLPEGIFGLSYGRTKEEAISRARRIAEALTATSPH
jgi:hypothetical protein